MTTFHPRTLILPFIIGIAGITAFLFLRPEISPKAGVDLSVTRTDAMAMAERFLSGKGYAVSGLSSEASFLVNAATQQFLVDRYGLEQANRMIRSDSLIVNRWQVYFYDARRTTNSMTDQFRVWVGQQGMVTGFNHIVQDSAGGAKLTADSAQQIAERFVGSMGEDLGRFFLKKTTSTQQVKRSDHAFIWASKDSVADARTEIMVRVQGNVVGMYSKEFVPPQGFIQWVNERFSSIAVITILSYIAIFFLVIVIISLFLKKYHEGEVGVRSALSVAATLFGIVAATMLLGYESIGFGVQLGDTNRTMVKLLLLALTLFIIYGFLSAMTFAAWSVGESSARRGWSIKLSGLDSLFRGRFFTANVAYSILWGFLNGFGVLGLVAVIYYLMLTYGGVLSSNISTGGIPESYSPALYAVLSSVSGAMITEITFRLFMMSWMRERIRSVAAGIILSAAIWALTASTLWDMPFGSIYSLWQFPLYFLLGTIFSLIFLRYGILASIIANSVVAAVGLFEPVLFSTGGSMLTEKIIFGILLALPFLAAVVGLVRREEFQFTPDTTPSHIKRISERERMAKELEIARAVQMKLLPKENPVITGYDIAGICLPAYEVGGDYYDFVDLGPSKIGIAIGDVSGKGVPAAIYMTLTKGILQSHAEENISPKNVLSKVNRLMYRTIEKNSFVSMFYAIIDLQSKRLRYSRAGHNPVILAGLRDEKQEFLTPKGVALGLDDGGVFDAVLEEREYDLRSGDILVFYTDGFTEARNGAGEEFTETRLLRSVAEAKERSAAEIIDVVVRDAKRFAGEAEQHDDMTMVVVKVH
ncbi:MAG: SpoIIE family protein phosphatase [Bacteroidetes bacterium]|nr:SpoIIE family protein phosphatase [Bacteroidota bacterium]